jgi:hypothetical protein
MIDIDSPRARWKRNREYARNANRGRVFDLGGYGFQRGYVTRHGVAHSLMSPDETYYRQAAARLVNRRALGAKPSNKYAREVISDMRSARALREES